jgi:hypothetical protein
MTKIGAWQFGSRSRAAIANASRDALTRDLEFDMEIEIGFASDEGVLLGALQRASDVPEEKNLIVRGTPGAAVRVGRGTLHVIVAIKKLECAEDQILNRHVRPILKALRAQYFGRDWISLMHRPIAHVGFAHLRATGRTVVEAFIAVHTQFAIHERPSHLAKSPATLDELAIKIDDARLVQSIVDAFSSDRVSITRSINENVIAPSDPPWTAHVEEAIGNVCAGRDANGSMRLGGEFMASFDAVRDLEDRITRGAKIRDAVNDAFAAPHTALFGVRSLESIARALEDAFR